MVDLSFRYFPLDRLMPAKSLSHRLI